MHPLKRERARQRLSLRDLSLKSGVHYTTISEIERRDREPQIVTLAKLADALGVDIETLDEEGRQTPKVKVPARA